MVNLLLIQKAHIVTNALARSRQVVIIDSHQEAIHPGEQSSNASNKTKSLEGHQSPGD
jgi:hypothetical protein